MKGECFDTAMDHLQKLGICTLSQDIGADTLGSTVRGIILEPFKTFLNNSTTCNKNSTSAPSVNRLHGHVGLESDTAKDQRIERTAVGYNQSISANSMMQNNDDRLEDVLSPITGANGSLSGAYAVPELESVDLAAFDIFQTSIDLTNYDFLR